VKDAVLEGDAFRCTGRQRLRAASAPPALTPDIPLAIDKPGVSAWTDSPVRQNSDANP